MWKICSVAFSLIELLVVIFIIGSLTSIAIPSYKNYILKTKVTEGFSLLAPLKFDIAEYYFSHNKFPSSINLSLKKDVTNALNKNKNFSSFKYVLSNNKAGLGIKLQEPPDKNKPYVYLWASSSGAFLDWFCGANGASDSIDVNFYPKSCLLE